MIEWGFFRLGIWRFFDMVRFGNGDFRGIFGRNMPVDMGYE